MPYFSHRRRHHQGLDGENIFPLLYLPVTLPLINIAAINSWWHMASLQPAAQRRSQPARHFDWKPQSATRLSCSERRGGGAADSRIQSDEPLVVLMSVVCLLWFFSFSFSTSVSCPSFSLCLSLAFAPALSLVSVRCCYQQKNSWKAAALTHCYPGRVLHVWAVLFCGGL